MALIIPPTTPRWGKPGRANPTATAAYTRPTDWLTVTPPGGAEQKFVGLLAIYNNDSNYIAMTFAGDYTVDWGDGSSPENVSSGIAAQHKYNWADVSSSTLTSMGYRQALVTVTPQIGQNLTSINLNVKHTRPNLQAYVAPWLDVAINGPNLTSIVFGASSTNVLMSMLEIVTIGAVGAITTASRMFSNCHSLGAVTIPGLPSCLDCSSMFYYCYSLTTVPLFNLAACTN